LRTWNLAKGIAKRRVDSPHRITAATIELCGQRDSAPAVPVWVLCDFLSMKAVF
jgi:hypothetical protein